MRDGCTRGAVVRNRRTRRAVVRNGRSSVACSGAECAVSGCVRVRSCLGVVDLECDLARRDRSAACSASQIVQVGPARVRDVVGMAGAGGAGAGAGARTRASPSVRARAGGRRRQRRAVVRMAADGWCDDHDGVASMDTDTCGRARARAMHILRPSSCPIVRSHTFAQSRGRSRIGMIGQGLRRQRAGDTPHAQRQRPGASHRGSILSVGPVPSRPDSSRVARWVKGKNIENGKLQFIDPVTAGVIAWVGRCRPIVRDNQ